MKTRTIGYWVTTGVLGLALLGAGLAYLARRPEVVSGMQQLGYPLYFLTILGTWKVLGAVALLAPRLPRVKEWAYAGVIFNMTAAAASHVASGSAAWHVVGPLVYAALAVASWALRPPSRAIEGMLLARSGPMSGAGERIPVTSGG